MAQQIQFRRGTAAAWTSANPTLAAGEVGFETDTGKFKIGDGATAWTSLAYFAADAASALVAANNLSDLDDTAAARTNLGLGTAATHAAGDFLAPTGDGSGLTGIDPAHIATGTAAIDISGNAATADTADHATTADSATTATTATTAAGLTAPITTNQVTGLDTTLREANDAGNLGSHAAALVQKLDRDWSDAVLLILSDSTGDAAGEWPDLLATWLAATYPAFTVTKRFWNTTTLVYNSPTTVQTGTGTHTLAVYIGGASGQDAGYAVTNLAAIAPVAPDLTIISYGHNSNSAYDIYRKAYLELTRAILRKWPGTSMIVTAQNPRAITASNYVAELSNVAVITGLAATEGYGLINVQQAFFDYGDYASDLLVDDTHPNAAGSALWLEQVKPHFRPARKYVQPAFPAQQYERHFVPASAFQIVEGTPTFGVVGLTTGRQGLIGWDFEDGVYGQVATVVDLPRWWRTVNAYLYWSQPTVATGSVVFNCGDQGIAEKGHLISKALSVVTGTASYSGGNFDHTYTRLQVRSQSGNGDWVPGIDPVLFQVGRDGANVADTYAHPVQFLGVLFERRS